MKKLYVYGLTLLLIGFLSACAGRVVEQPAAQVQGSAEEEAAEIDIEGAPAITPVEASPSAVLTLEASPTNTLVSVEATATQGVVVCEPHGDDLVSSDPANVQLASGGLQLVEFFAFW